MENYHSRMANCSNNGKRNRKKVLIVASVASMIDQFNIPNIKLLKEMGYDVDVAANFFYGSTCTNDKIQELVKQLNILEVGCYQIEFSRNATDIKADVKAFLQLGSVVCGKAAPLNGIRHCHISGHSPYAFIHAHSPIGGAVGRLVAKHYGIKAIYTAHGFHFYNGAPKKNWLLYYSVEWGLSWITDVIVTINHEDYFRARQNLHAKKTAYVPGVGVDVKKFQDARAGRLQKRAELGLAQDDIMLLSVGELNDNKNHVLVIEALGQIKSDAPNDSLRLHYYITGKGELRDGLSKLAYQLGVNLHLLGFRKDIAEINSAADIFIHPSKREGLPVALMEAMASGLPAIVTNIRGNMDLIRDGTEGIVVAGDAYRLAEAIKALAFDKGKRERMGQNAVRRIKRFDVKGVDRLMSKLYAETAGHR